MLSTTFHEYYSEYLLALIVQYNTFKDLKLRDNNVNYNTSEALPIKCLTFSTSESIFRVPKYVKNLQQLRLNYANCTFSNYDTRTLRE